MRIISHVALEAADFSFNWLDQIMYEHNKLFLFKIFAEHQLKAKNSIGKNET
jgi:hypothetical protein